MCNLNDNARVKAVLWQEMVQHVSSPFWQQQVRQLTFIQLVVPSSLCSPFGSSGGVDDLRAICTNPIVPKRAGTPVWISTLSGHGTLLWAVALLLYLSLAHGVWATRSRSCRQLLHPLRLNKGRPQQPADPRGRKCWLVGWWWTCSPLQPPGSLPGHCFAWPGVQSEHILSNCEWQESVGKGERASLAS